MTLDPAYTPKVDKRDIRIDLDGGIEVVLRGCMTEDGIWIYEDDMFYETDGSQDSMNDTTKHKLHNNERFKTLVELEMQVQERHERGLATAVDMVKSA